MLYERCREDTPSGAGEGSNQRWLCPVMNGGYRVSDAGYPGRSPGVAHRQRTRRTPRTEAGGPRADTGPGSRRRRPPLVRPMPSHRDTGSYPGVLPRRRPDGRSLRKDLALSDPGDLPSLYLIPGWPTPYEACWKRMLPAAIVPERELVTAPVISMAKVSTPLPGSPLSQAVTR